MHHPAPNHSIHPTGASRSGQCPFAHQWRLAPAADAERLGEQAMMPTDEQLAAAFDKGITEGAEKLVGTERDYYLIQDFILEYENGGLSGYLYNRIPDFGHIRAAVASLTRHGLIELGSILGEAAAVFAGYQEPDPPSTWRAVLQHYDPEGKLDELDSRIMRLKNYGLSQ
jgi:hypothetical protein